MAQNVPDQLFKYRTIGDFLRRTLVYRELWYPQYDTLNDPFDCAPIVDTTATHAQFKRYQLHVARISEPVPTRRMARQARKSLTKSGMLTYAQCGKSEGNRRVQDALMGEIGKTGILCLSADPTNVLMWSHYADEHRGLCLIFRTDFFEAFEVKYSIERPIVNPITRNADMINDAVFRKAEFWRYEQEWRVLSRHQTGAITFPVDALVGVVLGAKILPDIEKQVRDWCRQGCLNVAWYRAALDDREFRMNLIPA